MVVIVFLRTIETKLSDNSSTVLDTTHSTPLNVCKK